MRRLSWIPLNAILLFGSTHTAQAVFIYQFTTTAPAGSAGSLSLDVTASDAAVATGTLGTSNISGITLNLSGTSPPFSDGTLNSIDILTSFFDVDPTTGAFTSVTPSCCNTNGLPESIDMPSSTSLTASYVVTISGLQEQGTGVWSVTPEPGTAALVVVGGSIASAIDFWRRHKHRHGRQTEGVP